MAELADRGAPKHLLGESDRYWEREALPVLSQYVSIPCVSPTFDSDWQARGEIVRAARMLQAWAVERPIKKLSVELLQLEGLTPVLLADVASTRDGDSAAPTLLYGHLDKQPPLGGWRAGLGPYVPVREGDGLYGRGVADDGYAIFTALGAIEITEQAGLPHGRCLVMIEASEEGNSPHLPPYIDALRSRLSPQGLGLVICLDSSAGDYERLWTTTSSRGTVAATLRVSVLREGIHSGDGGGVVPDSFRLLRQLLSRIEDERTGKLLLNSCAAEIPSRRMEETRRLALALGDSAVNLPLLPGVELSKDATLTDRLIRRNWGACLTVDGADGLPSIAEAGDVLRPFTACKITLRLPPTADSTAVLGEMERRLLSDPPDGAKVELLDVGATDGFNAPETAAWLTQAVDDISLAYFGNRAGIMGDGSTDPALAKLLASYPNAQFVVTGVLGPASNAHGPNEMLHLPTAKRITAALSYLLSVAP